MEPDPFSLIYAYLWQLAESSMAFTSLVRLGNRIKFNDPTWQDPEKAEVSEGDLPEVVLMASQSGGNLHSTSSTSDITVTFDWVISTGDVSVTRAILPVLFAVYAAMANWKTGLDVLTWNGKTFVKNANMNQANLGMSDVERNRGIHGWSSIWSVELHCVFTTQDLMDLSNGKILAK